jgi:hypothetical protein
VVAADPGVVTAERGVKGVLARGESSVVAERVGAMTGMVPERSRVRDICCAIPEAVELAVGMTSGARLFGDSGCRT